MRLKFGLLVTGLAVGAMFWFLKPAYVLEVSAHPIPVDKRSIISVREDTIASVVQVGNTASAAPVRDPFVGNWSGDCGDLVQCTLKIEIVGKAYTLELKVAEWGKPDKVLCRLNGSMHISNDKQLLAGQMGSSPLSGVFLRGEGALQLHDVPGEDCSEFFDLDGIYRILGD